MNEVKTNAESLPELGTSEAALRSVVNLISRATGQPEELLAYWLDLYYQVRLRHEQPAASFHAVASHVFTRPADTDQVPSQGESVALRPLDEPSGISEQFEPVSPKKSRQAEAADFKRATFARLQSARKSGLSVPRIVSLAENNITEDEVRSIIDAKPMPIAVYRALSAALDKIEVGKVPG